MEFRYKPGDRVVVLDGENIPDFAGEWSAYKKGKVGGVYSIKEAVACFGKPAYCLSDCLAYWDERGLAPARADKIVITTDGDETLARWYKGEFLVKCAASHRSPSDTYDFLLGASFALSRLKDKEPEKLLSCKFFVLRGNAALKTNKIYSVKDGRFRDETGMGFPLGAPLRTWEELVSYLSDGLSDGARFHTGRYSDDPIRIVEVIE